MNCVSILKWLFKHKSLQTVFRTKHVSLFGNRYEKSEMEKKKETHQQRSKIPQAVMQHNRGNTNALFSNFFPSRAFKKVRTFKCRLVEGSLFCVLYIRVVFFGRGKIGYFSVISPKPNMSFTCP